METQQRQTVFCEPDAFKAANDVGSGGAADADTQTRIDILVKANSEFEQDKTLYRSEAERREAELMKNPISTKKAAAYFGAMLGLFPPSAIFANIIFNQPEPEAVLILLLILVNIVCTVAGYFSGKLLGKSLAAAESLSWSKMILALPFLGILWGLMTGAAGGVFIFVIGAFFGAFIAAAVGGAAFPVFGVLHRWLKRGDSIEEKHFFPVALGITLVITALILSFN